ncbi:MAG: DNA-processing protein DprA [Gammaproteobacteria bacterium]|nr:DNA-processing protein DprA [Gammaproteobacteria bacterium]
MDRDVTRGWLVLASAPGLDGTALATLIESFGGAAGLLAAGPSRWRAAGLAPRLVAHLQAPDEARIDVALDWLAAADDRHLIGVDDARYPPLLRQIADPPAALFLRGDPQVLTSPQLAIVGSRNASPGGLDNATAFARHLAACGLTITSGLALGIDTAAHRGALAAGGLTLAVLGTGPDRIYPAQNAALAGTIAGSGAVCSEFLPGMPPLRENFPRRNRIISALAAGTLVVEAGVQSGALITARRAIEQGREVFAVPGSIHNPLAKGCHRLIREGAKLVESAEHILEELAPLLAPPPAPQAARATASTHTLPSHRQDPDYLRLLEALGWDTLDADTLARRSGLTSAEVSSMLLILELEGSVLPLAGGRYQRQR